MANTKVQPILKRNPVMITIPVWLNNALSEKAKMMGISKGALVESAIKDKYGFSIDTTPTA